MEGNTVERAFMLARSGRYRSIEDLHKALEAEHCTGVAAHLSGSSIRRDLMRLMKAARMSRAQP